MPVEALEGRRKVVVTEVFADCYDRVYCPKTGDIDHDPDGESPGLLLFYWEVEIVAFPDFVTSYIL